MAEKRKREADDASGDRKKSKVKRGFRVGPDNLPDGPYKRKVQKLKSQLIEKARIKKDYSKVQRERDEAEKAERPLPDLEDANEPPEPNTTPHPDRQTLMDKASESPEPQRQPPRNRTRKPKATPFKREYEQAQQRRAKAEDERKAREEAIMQRQQKRDERERFQRAMAKARRGGPNGQRKLGRESHVLLDKVKRMVGEGG